MAVNGAIGAKGLPDGVDHHVPGVASLTEHNTSASVASRPRVSVPSSYLLPDGTPDYVRLILTSRVYDVVNETPLTHSISMSENLNAKILLKREDLQPVFSFKLRGAYNKIAHLPLDERWKGVIACSAGEKFLILSSKFINMNRQPCAGSSIFCTAFKYSVHDRDANRDGLH
jgi:hypothetical protein